MSDSRCMIIEAAIEEFGRQSYKNASTNKIAERAGVSKGLVFHHFSSKEKLYMACVEQVLGMYLSEFDNTFDLTETDFIKRYKALIRFKTDFITRSNKLGRFFVNIGWAYLDKSIPALVEYTQAIYNRYWKIVREGIDVSRYRPGLDPQKVEEYIVMVMEAYASKFNFEKMEYDQIIPLMEQYWEGMSLVEDMLRHGVYKD